MEVQIKPTEFYVIAACAPGACVKFWRSKASGGEWVADIAKAKHYATIGIAKSANNNNNGYLYHWGKVSMLQQYGNDVSFHVLKATAHVELVVAD